ncbi:hypothetical protein B0A55_07207 [Friedmanniomyces simplex]|uniref:Uncharacterized protein n=1 Tax=Friedmanniomyces simplex TaxID=329884 RepID=A0A4U0XIC6_9PEZI|nr:hypothetical protein B0A55_07207 [Friedmanniomyces simplex]
MQGRLVCCTWRQWIPRICAEKYLVDPKMMSTRYDLAALLDQHTDKYHMLMLVMTFDRFHPTNRDRCIFKQDPEYLRHDPIRLLAEVQRRVLGDALATGGPPDLPTYVILLKGRANGTELPGLVVDEKKREMSFLWPQMFHAFLSEAERQENRNMKQMEIQMAKLVRAQQTSVLSPARERRLTMSIYNANIEVWKDVRRERLAKLLAKKSQLKLNVEEEWFKRREAEGLQLIADQEAKAELSQRAEDAE